jgi:hypothetical protein
MMGKVEPSWEPVGGGVLRLVLTTPTVIHTRLSGRFDMALASCFIETLEGWMGGRTCLHAFHDCMALEDYEVDARTRITEWSRAHAAPFSAVHLLVRSRVVAWGVRLVTSLTGDLIVAHAERATFDAARARVCHGNVS